jgi:hypothetical protein
LNSIFSAGDAVADIEKPPKNRVSGKEKTLQFIIGRRMVRRK